MQGASVTSMHFRVLIWTLQTMVHAHARECKVKVKLYRSGEIIDYVYWIGN